MCRVEERPEQNHLVEPSRLLPIAANKNRDQPDGRSHPTNTVGPNHCAGNGEETMAADRFSKVSLTAILFPVTP